MNNQRARDLERQMYKNKRVLHGGAKIVRLWRSNRELSLNPARFQIACFNPFILQGSWTGFEDRMLPRSNKGRSHLHPVG